MADGCEPVSHSPPCSNRRWHRSPVRRCIATPKDSVVIGEAESRFEMDGREIRARTGDTVFAGHGSVFTFSECQEWTGANYRGARRR